MSRTVTSLFRATVLLAAGVGIAACEQPQAQGHRPMPPPPVAVTEMKAAAVPLSFAYGGRIAAFREVEVRARVSGILVERSYTEGAKVRAGDVLFRIDPASFDAEVARARAQLQQAQAQLAQAERDSARAVTLYDRKFGTEKARDDALSSVDLGKAAVAAAEAQLRTAEINLGYTTIRAPADGIAGLKMMPEGSLVGTGANDGLLTRVTQVDPVYVNFAFSDTELTEIRQLLKLGKAQEAGGRLTVQVGFGDGRSHVGEGHVDFIDASVDLQTGTVRARAIVPNTGGELRPGNFVRVAIGGVTLEDAIVVPQAAVMQGPQGQFVYAVDRDGKATVRPIAIGREFGQGWIVKSGLASGDRVVTEGMIKVRPGAPVLVAETEQPMVRAAKVER